MDIAMEKIMSLCQEGMIHSYCQEFMFLFNQVKHSEEMSEYYAIYLFMNGLKPDIRDVFITWHQYSLHTMKDTVSLALKLDENGLKDSFSPYDPDSSLYNALKVFDVDDVLGESGNDDKIAPKVFDEMPSSLKNEIQEIIDEGMLEIQNESVVDVKDSLDVKKIDVSKSGNEIIRSVSEMFESVPGDDLNEDLKKKEKDNENNQVHADFRNDVQEKELMSIGPRSHEMNSEARECYLEQCLEVFKAVTQEEVYVSNSVWTDTGWNTGKLVNQLGINNGPVLVITLYDIDKDVGCESEQIVQLKMKIVLAYLGLGQNLFKMKTSVYRLHNWKSKFFGWKISSKGLLRNTTSYCNGGCLQNCYFLIMMRLDFWAFWIGCSEDSIEAGDGIYFLSQNEYRNMELKLIHRNHGLYGKHYNISLVDENGNQGMGNRMVSCNLQHVEQPKVSGLVVLDGASYNYERKGLADFYFNCVTRRFIPSAIIDILYQIDEKVRNTFSNIVEEATEMTHRIYKKWFVHFKVEILVVDCLLLDLKDKSSGVQAQEHMEDLYLYHKWKSKARWPNSSSTGTNISPIKNQLKSSESVLKSVGAAILGAILCLYQLGVVDCVLEYFAKELIIAKNILLQGWTILAHFIFMPCCWLVGSFTKWFVTLKFGRIQVL